MTVHRFRDSLARGEAEERRLDAFFGPVYLVVKAGWEEQRQGIDRHFIDRTTGAKVLIDYKADFRAAQTGNIYIETISVDIDGKPGWAAYSRADLLLEFIPPLARIYVVSAATVRRLLPLWLSRYPSRPAQNEGYRTVGLLVPMGEIAGIAAKRLEFGGADRSLPEHWER